MIKKEFDVPNPFLLLPTGPKRATIVDLLLLLREIAICFANNNQKHTKNNQITKRLNLIQDNSKSQLKI